MSVFTPDDRATSERDAWQELNNRLTTGANRARMLAAGFPDDTRLRDKATTLTELAEHVTDHPFDPDGRERVALRQMVDDGLTDTTGGTREAYVTLCEYTRTI